MATLKTRIKRLIGRYDGEFFWYYAEWRARRLAFILRHYGVDYFLGKSVLELGAGYGDIGNTFATLGGKVTCMEGRKRNVQMIRKRFPYLTAIHADLNEDSSLPETNFQIVVHMGLLYHLRDHVASLRQACAYAEKDLILETEVSDSDDPNFVQSVKEDSGWYDQALDGKGIRPSSANVELVLKQEGFEFTRFDDPFLNAEIHRYDWSVTNSGKWESGLRRFWLCKRVKSREMNSAVIA
jgi:hypothetical protein